MTIHALLTALEAVKTALNDRKIDEAMNMVIDLSDTLLDEFGTAPQSLLIGGGHEKA